jgi:hypothetical protein
MYTYMTPAGANSKPPIWRRLRYFEQIDVAHAALIAAPGIALAVNINLNPAIAARAGDDMDGVRRRFRQTLRRYLRRCDLLYLLAFEATEDERLHVHGTIGAQDEGEIPLIRRALKVAAGKWVGKGRARQVRIVLSPDRLWGGYCAKNQGLPAGCRIPGTEQACWMMSHALGRLAKALHVEARDQKGKSAPRHTAPPKPQKAFCHRDLVRARANGARKAFSYIPTLPVQLPIQSKIQIKPNSPISTHSPLLHRLE